MNIGYARVSTKDQSLDLQIDALKKAGCRKIYSEQISGSKSNRPELDSMMTQLREGDVVVDWKLDHLGRSLRNLVSKVNTGCFPEGDDIPTFGLIR